jgi:RecA/RadA recombinase
MPVPLDTVEVSADPVVRLKPDPLHSSLGELLVPREISLLHCSERSPLTYLAHSVVVQGAETNPGRRFVYLDSGSNYHPNLARAMCRKSSSNSETLDRIVVGKVMSLSDVEETASALAEMGHVVAVVLDSLTGALNMSGSPGKAGRQRALFHCLEVLRRTVNELNAHLMLTDFSSRNWGSGTRTPIGGNVLAHAVDSVVQVDRLDINQSMIRILVERSPVATNSEAVIVRITPRGVRSMK